jgi:hypothetical protein
LEPEVLVWSIVLPLFLLSAAVQCLAQSQVPVALRQPKTSPAQAEQLKLAQPQVLAADQMAPAPEVAAAAALLEQVAQTAELREPAQSAI